jgi:hypothetical protein
MLHSESPNPTVTLRFGVGFEVKERNGFGDDCITESRPGLLQDPPRIQDPKFKVPGKESGPSDAGGLPHPLKF